MVAEGGGGSYWVTKGLLPKASNGKNPNASPYLVHNNQRSGRQLRLMLPESCYYDALDSIWQNVDRSNL